MTMTWRDLDPDIFLTARQAEWKTENISDCAAALWNMLEDIDTATDMFQPGDPAFFAIICAILPRRFEHARPEMFGDTEALVWLHQ